jgi:uncharacterized RmlC-like cupin family protein
MSVDQKPTCAVVSSSETYTGKQALTYFSGVSAENCAAQGLCMHLVTIRPGGRAKAHLHQNHETALYVLSGEAGMWYGENLSEQLTCRAGDFLYIPAGMPHLPYNASQTEPCTAVLARTDPNEQESVVMQPHLDALR